MNNKNLHIIKSIFFLLSIFTVITSCGQEIDAVEKDDEPKVNLQVWLIAHRGCWDDTNPQNSLAAFKRALELNIYGTETDIWQTQDGHLVVNHDPTYNGLSIANSTYDILSQHKLSNGEPLPLFESFLQAKKEIGGSVKLIIELKSCNVNDLVALVDSYGLHDEVEYISFSANLCDQLVELGYGHKTCYLSGNLKPARIKERGYGGIDYQSSVLEANPAWVKESQNLGLKTIVWTVNDMERISRYAQQGVLVTTDKPMEAIFFFKRNFYNSNEESNNLRHL